MSEITVEKEILHPDHTDFSYKAMDGDTVMSKGNFQYINTRFGQNYIKTMTAGGIETPVHFRRHGNVRKIFQEAHEAAVRDDVLVAILHPFSFSYYQMFGYGKISDHLIARCPVRMIDMVDRCCDLVPYDGTPEMLQDLLTVYNRFTKGRTLMRQRYNDTYFQNKTIYIYYEDGAPTGYISFSTKKTFCVNHMTDGLMTVHETAYITPKALRSILGFIRMFEGELETVEFTRLESCPEIQLLIKHDTHTTYQRVPDIMARVIHTEKFLKAMQYPAQEGTFRLRVEDTLPSGQGSFQVNYGKDGAVVTRLDDSAATDITLTMPAFSRLVYGYDGVCAREAAYMNGVSISGNADDFFRAFPKQHAGAFEHF